MIGQPVRRKEDDRLLRGAGCYADDWNLPGQAYACMVRSPHAHAKILSISSAAASKIPGVLTSDPGMGVMRHADAGYPSAIEVAKARGVKIPGVTV